MSLPPAYAPFRAFTEPARYDSPPWLVVGGLTVAEVAFWLSPLLLLPIFGTGLAEALEGRTAVTLALSLILYGVPALTLVVWVRRVHGQGGWSLIGPPLTAFAQFKRAGGGVLLALLAISVVLPAYDMAEIADTRPLAQWLVTLPLAVLAVTIQSGAEEVVFRGYLQQHLGARSDRPLVWMVLPSVLFGVLHYGNALGSAEGTAYVVWAILLGMACADLTARTGTIGAAIGLHSANNLAVFALYGMQDGPDSGFALFLLPFAAPEAGPSLADYPPGWLVLDTVFSAVFVLILWLAARVAIRR